MNCLRNSLTFRVFTLEMRDADFDIEQALRRRLNLPRTFYSGLMEDFENNKVATLRMSVATLLFHRYLLLHDSYGLIDLLSHYF